MGFQQKIEENVGKSSEIYGLKASATEIVLITAGKKKEAEKAKKDTPRSYHWYNFKKIMSHLCFPQKACSLGC